MNDLRKLFLLRPDVIFLNHGSFGACPIPVFEAYQYWQMELERQPVEFLGRRFKDLMRDARRSLGDFIGADSDDCVFVPNATTGLNVIARSLLLGPGDEVLTTNQEYGAIDRTWRFVCHRRGATYVRAPIQLPVESRQEVVEAIWSKVSPRTRILALSHITSPSAFVTPIEPLIRRATLAGILTVVDGAHAPGQIPLNLKELNPDFYVGNCHKWMLGPKGSAFLYARRDVQHLLQPLVVSWGWQSDTPGPSRFIDEQEYQGTRDIAAYLAVPTAINFLAQYDWDSVRRECHRLVRYARDEITRLTGLPPITPDTSAWYAQMASFPLPADHIAKKLQSRLYDEFGIEIPATNNNGQWFLRLSVQGYNSEADVQALIDALKHLLGRPD